MMEELYFTSNDGELSYVETDGGILLEQGSQGYLSQADQGQQNIIYTPQVSEQQVYIIQQVQHASDNQQYIYGAVNSPQVMHGKTMVQNVQAGSTSNAEYAVQDRSLPVRQPVQHRIVQVVQQQPTLQLSNSHVLQIPIQSQQHITLSASQPITYIQKTASDSSGKVHLIRQPLNIASIQPAGPRGAIRLIPGQSLPYSVQQTRPTATRPYMQRPQNSVSVTQHQPVIVQNAQNSGVRQGFQENYLKQIEYKVAMAQSKGRGGRNNRPVTQQRRNLSQKLNTKLLEEKGNTERMLLPPHCSTEPQGMPKQIPQKNLVQMGGITTPESQPQQKPEMKNMAAVVHINADKSYSLSITEDNPESISSNKAPVKKISLEQYKSRNTHITMPDRDDNVTIREAQHPSLSMLQKVERRNSNVTVVNNRKIKKVYYVKPDSHVNKVLAATTTTTSISQQSFGTSDVSSLESLPENTPENLISTTTTNFVASANTTTIQNFTIAQDGNSISPQKHAIGRGTLVVCQNCGIENDTLSFCSGCKRPLNKNHRLMTFARKISSTSLSSNVTNSSLSFLSNMKETSNDSHISKQDFYGKANIPKIISTEKKPTLSSILATRGKCPTRGRGRGKPKVIEEPEVFTLTSDDDDDDNSTSSQSGSANEQISIKEPNMDPDMEDLLDSVTNISVVPAKEVLGMVSFNCRSIRIGSYKYLPEEKVDVKPGDFIQFKAPSLIEGDQNLVTIKIHFNCVSRLLCHFGMSIPVIFIYMRPSEAKNIRKQLNMYDKNQCYFDPTSREQTQKRITILLVKMDEETKHMLKDLLNLEATNKLTGNKTKLFEEINQKEANEILLKSSPLENSGVVKKTNPPTNLSETKTLLIYPPPPHKGGITITTDDYICLKEEQFLNDVVIEFYNKWIFLKKLTAEDRERTHMFSTFFYKRLTSKPKKGRVNSSEENPDLTPAQKRHARVKSWTKNVNIFEKDFVLIPINEHSHWFLAVICFPGLDGPIDINDGQPVQTPFMQQSNLKTKSKTKIEIPVVDDVEWSDRDEAEGDDDELDYEDEEEDKEKEPKKLIEAPCDELPNREGNVPMVKDAGESLKSTDNNQERGLKTKATVNPINIKQPCILIFDSLSGASRCKIVATLRDYLTVEYFAKKKVEKVFSKDTMKGACPKVPQQTNYSDCGIFTLQFAESFFENKIKSFKLPIKTLMDWFPQEVVARKRENIAKLIKDLMDEFKPNHGITLPAIRFNSIVKVEPSSILTSEMNEATEGTAVDEDQETSGNSDEVLIKRKADELTTSDNDKVSFNVNDVQSFKSRKLNFKEDKTIINFKSGEIRKVTKPANNIIIQKSNNKFMSTSNQTVNQLKDVNNSFKCTSNFPNLSDNKMVMIGCMSNQPQLNTTTSQPFIGTKVEKVEKKLSCQSFGEKFLKSEPAKSPPIRYEIRDEDTSEVLLIFNATSTNDESSDCLDGSSNVTSTGSNSSINVTGTVVRDNTAISQVQNINSTVTDNSSIQPTNQVKLVSSSKNCDAAFDMLMQSTIQKQGNIGIYASGNTGIQAQQTQIRPTRPNPNLIHLQSQNIWPKSNLNTIQSQSLSTSGTATFVVSQPSCAAYSTYQSLSAGSSSQLTYTRSPTGPKMYGNAAKIMVPNVQTVTSSSPCQSVSGNMKESGMKYAYESSIDRSSNIKFVNSIKGKSCPVTNFQFPATSTFQGPTYTSVSAPLPIHASGSNVASLSLVPSWTQASFNVTHKAKNINSEDISLHVQTKFKSDVPHTQGSNVTTKSLLSNNITNHSSNVSNTLTSSSTYVLPQPELITAVQSPTRTTPNGPNIHSTAVPSVLKCSTPETSSTFSSYYGSSTMVSASSQSSQTLTMPGGTNYNNETPLPNMTLKADSPDCNLFSTSMLSATTNTEPLNISSHPVTNIAKGPFSQSQNDIYAQYNSSDSQLISDSELLLSFASQSAVVSPCINLSAQSIPSTVSYASSNFSNPTETDNSKTLSFSSSIPYTSEASDQPACFPSLSNHQSLPSDSPSSEINHQSVNSGWPDLVKQCKLSNSPISISKTTSKHTVSRPSLNDPTPKSRVAHMNKFKSKPFKQIKSLKPENLKSNVPPERIPFSRTSTPVTYSTSRSTPKLLESKNTVDISPSKSRIATSFSTQTNTRLSPISKNSKISSSTDVISSVPRKSQQSSPYCYPQTATEYQNLSSTANPSVQSPIKTDSHASASYSPLLASALVSTHSPIVHCSHYPNRFFPSTSSPSASSFVTSNSPGKSDSSVSSPTQVTFSSGNLTSPMQSPPQIGNLESLSQCNIEPSVHSDAPVQSFLQQQSPSKSLAQSFSMGPSVALGQSPVKHDCLSPEKSVATPSLGDSSPLQPFIESLTHQPSEYSNPPVTPIGKHYESESPPSSPFLKQTPPLGLHSPPSPPVFTPNRTTSSGRNVSIPKRYLDSEQEQFFQHTKKRKEKFPSTRGRKAEKSKKLNYFVN